MSRVNLDAGLYLFYGLGAWSDGKTKVNNGTNITAQRKLLRLILEKIVELLGFTVTKRLNLFCTKEYVFLCERPSLTWKTS